MNGLTGKEKLTIKRSILRRLFYTGFQNNNNKQIFISILFTSIIKKFGVQFKSEGVLYKEVKGWDKKGGRGQIYTVERRNCVMIKPQKNFTKSVKEKNYINDNVFLKSRSHDKKTGTC